MVRNFNLINELGQVYSFMDIKKYCLLTEPDGLGCSFETDYKRIGTSFINNYSNIEQTQIGGTLNFLNYDNYTDFVNFVASSNELKLQYKIPKKDNKISTYYKDVVFKSITKTEKRDTAVISEALILEATSLWYEENAVVYSVSEDTTSEIRWNFEWDSSFADYENRSITFENNSHIEAPFLLQINGYVNKPKITIYENDTVINELEVNTLIDENEKFELSTKDTDLYIHKIDADGNKINLFNTLDLNNVNFFKIPKGLTTIKLSSTDSEILSAKLIIYKQYISV